MPSSPSLSAASAPTFPGEEDCDKIQKQYKACAALQYDRWIHPTRHNTPSNYDECADVFEAWKACVLGKRGLQKD